MLHISVSLELPNIDSIFLTSTVDNVIIFRVKHQAGYWVDMTDESLVVVWHSLVSFVIPHFDQVVFTAREEVITIVGNIKCCHISTVHSCDLFLKLTGK